MRAPALVISDLNRIVRKYWPAADPELLPRAYRFADVAHGDQKRLDGTPYIQHPLQVGGLLAEVESDPTAVAAALLHDVVEDTPTRPEEIEAEFGGTVRTLVEGVTKLSLANFRTREEGQAHNLRKMFLAMADDVRVILIKLADRLHNMRTLEPLEAHRREAIAEETLHIYAPLAHRLGVRRFKWELEDLAFKTLDPAGFHDISSRIGAGRAEREAVVAQAIADLQEQLREADIGAKIEGRPKHFFSIYQKMQRQSIDFDHLGDLMALRVIVESVPDCYSVLGIVHKLWIPITDQFSDYVAKPKPNGYQSLHTKVVGLNGQPMEVQIRTREMHRVAEHGIAAHWRYKEGGQPSRFDEQMMAWMEQLRELEDHLPDEHEWLELVRLDLFKDQVFVFTPNWDVIDLPAGAGPLDFAYRIHTDVGNHCAGAKVNGKLVSLDYQFRNGDIVEITTHAGAHPTVDWLKLIVGSGAKSKVRRYLRDQVRDETIGVGREALERAVRRLPPDERSALRMDDLVQVARSFNLRDEEALFAAIGFGEIEPETVLIRLQPEPQGPRTIAEEIESFRDLEASNIAPAARASVTMGDIDGLAARRAKCCNPLPGDPIRGYITRGEGLAIHRADCKNLQHRTALEPERVQDLRWGQQRAADTYRASIELVALDRVGLLAHITAVVSESGLNIASAAVDAEKGNVATIRLVVDVENRAELNRLVDRLRNLIDVIDARAVPNRATSSARR
ncbi:MAG: bifunctional (p)ppGpp synthetase/guanosine-3',5'-bis(diphosphate) 3'-pyrophosphohydrolase [Armatimonadetes bacterium]|nr:bifunctional (p)ppGpp synthetase/guanosine-3',5'-bis(diphosphate) 3'-pyrophosphohydrolase [Armatimonadota bacterium]